MSTKAADKSNSVLSDLLNEKTDLSPSNDFVVPLKTSDKGNSREFTIGVPRAELTNRWWTTFASIPAGQNPLNVDNKGVIDDIPQTGGVHFLGGVFGGSEETKITRDVTIADNQSIVLPILTQGADNVWGTFFEKDFPSLPVPYQFSIDELRIITKAFMDTATGVSLEVNDKLLISDDNKEQYRQTSPSPYNLNLPATDDILGYRQRAINEEWPPKSVQPPYTHGVQDGYWVELKKLPLGENTIHFGGTIDYSNIDAMYLDYNKNGIQGDTPLEYVMNLFQQYGGSPSLDVTYNVNVLARPEFNAQLRG